jgi:hypothetical protein
MKKKKQKIRTIKVQLANGIIFPTKWETRNIFKVRARNSREAAYKAVRKSHDFLTDDNHTYKSERKFVMWGGKKCWYSSCKIFPNENTPNYLQSFFVDYWFSVEYRTLR